MAFKCDNCNRTWPDAKNRMDDPNGYENEGICPECYEGDDDKDEDSRNPFGNISAKARKDTDDDSDDDDDDEHPWGGHPHGGIA